VSHVAGQPGAGKVGEEDRLPSTTVIDISDADQIKLLDTLHARTSSAMDARAGPLAGTLQALTDVGFFDMVKAGEFNFALLHVVGSSVASLDEISEVPPLAEDKKYFVVKNFINETSFFEWNPDVYKSYFKVLKNAMEIYIPKLNEMAYEQVEIAGVPFATLVANRNPQGCRATTRWCCADTCGPGSIRSAPSTTELVSSACSTPDRHQSRNCHNTKSTVKIA